MTDSLRSVDPEPDPADWSRPDPDDAEADEDVEDAEDIEDENDTEVSEVAEPEAPPAPSPTPAERPIVVDAEGTVRAAGGVVWTRWGDGRLRILLVHRPKYDDWSLPKGKVDLGETDRACALREVQEETGLTCALGEELPSTNYLDRHGRPKTVRYYSMQPVGGVFAPQREVDQICWLPVDEATRLLSYEHDAAVVAALAGREEGQK